MSYPAYPDYKDSGVEWLGEVPAYWEVVRVKSLFEIKKRIAGSAGHEILSITQKGIKIKDISSDEGQISSDYSKYQLVKPGDFAMNQMDLLTGYVDISKYQGVTSPDYRVFALRDTDKSCARYFLWVFKNAYHLRIFFPYGKGAAHLGRWRLPANEFNSFLVPYPSVREQETISHFLDHETARIDALVEEQQRLIALLKEKRRAVISHAVTKGLDTDVPMKDSGVEWLGEVPEHWDVTRGKMVSDIFIPQRNKPELNESADGYFWVTMEDMRSEEISKAKRCVSIAEITKTGSRVLEKGAVVASCVGNFGIASLLLVDAVINQQLQAYIPRGISAAYLRDVITCSKPYFDLVGTAATLVYVNQEGFANLPVPLPPIDEQKEIEAYISKSNADFDVAISGALKLIALLQERRSALISAAVTGKIDVRGWKSPTDSVVSTEAKQIEVV